MNSALRPAIDLLIHHAAYHRDHRNIVTHLVGIPLTVFAVGVLLARPGFQIAGLLLTPAWLLWLASSAWYLTRGEFMLGMAVSVANAMLVALGQPLAALSTAAWLAWGGLALVLGGVAQVIGHYYEGRRSPLTDEPISLLVAPMFVTAEALFALGWKHELLQAIERRAGPVVLHDIAARA